MPADNGLDNGKSQSAAWIRVRIPATMEAVEDLGHIVWGNADASVGYGEFGVPVLL